MSVFIQLIPFAIAVALFAFQPVANAKLIATVVDTNDFSTEVFTDLDYGIAGATVIGVEGLVVFGSSNSTILSNYWAGELTFGLSNYGDPSLPGALITGQGSLNALAIGDNVAIDIVADEYLNPTGSPIGFETIVNASTLIDTEYSFLVDVLGQPNLLTAAGIDDTNTYSASAVYDITAPFGIVHTILLDALELDAQFGVDMSTRAFAVPAPAPLALVGLGLLGIGAVRKYRAF